MSNFLICLFLVNHSLLGARPTPLLLSYDPFHIFWLFPSRPGAPVSALSLSISFHLIGLFYFFIFPNRTIPAAAFYGPCQEKHVATRDLHFSLASFRTAAYYFRGFTNFSRLSLLFTLETEWKDSQTRDKNMLCRLAPATSLHLMIDAGLQLVI